MSLSAVSAAFLFAGTTMDIGGAACERLADLGPSTPPPAETAFVAPPPLVPTVVPLHAGVSAPVIAANLADPSSTEPAAQKRVEDGEIVVTGRLKPPPEDPAQAINMASFEVVQAIDQNVMRPAALAYADTVPAPIRDGVRNFLDHLTEPVNAINFLLQGKIGKAFETVGRFAINSTLGVLGIIDVAKRKPFYLPLRINGFGDTMGYYGVKPGPFLYLPLIGPTTVRDLVGIILNRSFIPTFAGRPFNRPYFFIPAAVLGQIDRRAQLDEELQARRNDTRGAYTATREDYLARRQSRINALHGIYDPKEFPPPRVVPTLNLPKKEKR